MEGRFKWRIDYRFRAVDKDEVMVEFISFRIKDILAFCII